MNVDRVVPEAQSVVRYAASVYQKYTRPWFIGLAVHGSAVKGGYIPGCSDIDFQLYLEDAAYDAWGQLPVDLCLAIHQELSALDPHPFRYLQCEALSPSRNYGGLIPNAYQIVCGTAICPDATDADVHRRARDDLQRLVQWRFPVNGLLDHGDGRLQRQIRWLCTQVWPTLYAVLTMEFMRGTDIWAQTKTEAIQLLPAASPLGQAIRSFYQSVSHYYPQEDSLDAALSVISTGITFLELVKTWWSDVGRAKSLG